MRRLVLVGIAATLVTLAGAGHWPLVAQEPAVVTAAQVDRWMQELLELGPVGR